jgi:hypothetical protein
VRIQASVTPTKIIGAVSTRQRPKEIATTVAESTERLRIMRIAIVDRRIGYVRVKNVAIVFPIALGVFHVCPTPRKSATKPVSTIETMVAAKKIDGPVLGLGVLRDRNSNMAIQLASATNSCHGGKRLGWFPGVRKAIQITTDAKRIVPPAITMTRGSVVWPCFLLSTIWK